MTNFLQSTSFGAVGGISLGDQCEGESFIAATGLIMAFAASRSAVPVVRLIYYSAVRALAIAGDNLDHGHSQLHVENVTAL